MPCHAMPCHAMPCHAMPCHAMASQTIPYHTPYHTKQRSILNYPKPCHSMICTNNIQSNRSCSKNSSYVHICEYACTKRNQRQIFKHSTCSILQCNSCNRHTGTILFTFAFKSNVCIPGVQI